MAYWGLPSFARCISHEYRYLYLSVSVLGCVGKPNDVSQVLVGGGMSLRLVHSSIPWYMLCFSLSGKLLLICQGLSGIFLYPWYIPLGSDPQFPILSFLDTKN